ncbi:MAG: hypothetical protein KF678_11120 [Phycisphaeraceae bacterium]|nr:hypothetical protein [Phycisphaeraceae bacterium]
MIDAVQVEGLGAAAWWPFGPSKDQEEAAYQLTMLPVYKRQLDGLRSKLDAARARGEGRTPAYTDASYKVMVAEQKFDQVHATALQWYEQAQRAGKVRPLDEQMNGGLAGTWRAVLTIAIGVAIVVVGVVAAPAVAGGAAITAFVVACKALIALIGTATAAAGGLALVFPPEQLGAVAGSGAIIAFAAFAIFVLSRLRRPR